MDANEIVKHAPEIAKGAAALAASVPFTAIVKRMLGPAADELAEMWRDRVRLYRYDRQLKCVEKAEKMAQDAGFTPQAVPPKILFPLLEGASLEEDESLHDMWAALLANAASGMSKIVRPGFIMLLREMAPDEAEVLAAIAVGVEQLIEFIGNQEVRHDPRPPYEEEVRLLRQIQADFRTIPGEDEGERITRFDACIQALETAGLIVRDDDFYRLTGRGRTFVIACRPPRAK